MFLQASFLMGIFTANKMLLNGNSSGKIGYLSRKGDDMSYRNLNAFSIGISMVDPDAKISLKVINEVQSSDYRSEWQNAGVNIFADIEIH